MDKMNDKEIKIDFKELKKDKEENAKQRKWFINFWADYIKTHTDEEWSKQQNVIIDSQIN